MTISAYQVDNVIKAYNKQSKTSSRVDAPQTSSQDKYRDYVTLSGNDGQKDDAYKKISYSLLDILLNGKS